MQQLREAAKRGDVTSAERCLEILLGAASQDPARVPLYAWNWMIQTYVGAGRRRRAEAVVETLHKEGPPPNATSYLPFLGWHRSRGGSEQALAVWKAMLERNVAPDIYCFNTLAAVYAEEGKAAAVESLIASMAQWSLRPTRATFHTLLKAHVKSGAPERAIQALDQMDEGGFPVSRSTVAALANELRRQGFLSLAAETLQHPRAHPPNREIVHSRLHLARATGDLAGALRAVRSLPLPSSEERAVGSPLGSSGGSMCANATTISIAVDVAGECKDVRAVEELLDRMDAERIHATAQLLTAVLGACRAAGDVAAAHRLWNRLVSGEGEGPDGDDDDDGVVAAGKGRIPLVVRGSGDPLTVVHFNILVDLYARAGDVDAAHRVVSEMEAMGMQPTEVTWTSLLLGPARAGDVEATWAIVRRRLEIGGGTSAGTGSAAPSAAVWNALFVAYRERRDSTGIETVLDAMAKAGSVPGASTVRHMVDVWLQEPRGKAAPSLPSHC